MKTTLKICATELRNLFYSPIAWFLLIVFLIQCAMNYMAVISVPVITQEIGGPSLRYLNTLTDRVFASQDGFFAAVMRSLYLYIPLLTMGLISRETGSGTIKLLFSSPVSVRQIVVGKYLAMMVYGLIMTAIIGLFMVVGAFNIVHADVGVLVSAALGFYLLVCAYAAIGLFMSSLTTYQVVAAISTFIAIGALNYIGSVWQDVDFMRQVTYFLSMRGRAEHVLIGLISTKDLVYFLVIIGVFLGITVHKLRAAMESQSLAVRVGRYAGTVAAGIVVGCICSLPALTKYIDLTRNQTRTLVPQVQELIAQMDGKPLEVTTFVNVLDQTFWLGMPSQRNNLESFWEQYLRFKPDMDFKYEYYYDEPLNNRYFHRDEQYKGKTLKDIADIVLKASRTRLPALKSPQEIRRIIDLEPELNRFVMRLKYGDQTTLLRIFDDPELWPGETEVAAAIKRLLQSQMPKLVFVTGQRERDISRSGDRDYKTLTNLSTFRHSLTNQGFDVQSVALDSEEIPADATALVLADPTTQLGAAALSRLERYIDDGGNLFIAGEPSRIAVLNPLLKKLGVQLAEGTLVQPSRDQHESLVASKITPFAATFTRLLADLLEEEEKPVTLPGSTAVVDLQAGAFAVHPLLMTRAKESWLEKQPLTDAAPATFSAADGDERQDFITMASLTRQVKGREQRIVVSGDADFMSNAELQRNNIATYNFLFSTALFSWLDEGHFPIDAARPPALDKRVTLGTDQLERLRVLVVWILPGLLLAFGTVLLIRRRRK